MNPQDLCPSGTLLIFCDGGFANRVNALVSGLELAEHLGLPHRILWPRNNRCGAAFADIFDTRTEAHETRLQDFVPEEARLQLWLHENDTGFRGPVTPLRSLSSLDDLRALRGADPRAVLFCENAVLPWLPAAALAEKLVGLRLRSGILDRTSALLARHAPESYIGIHLRATDFTSPPPVDSMLGLVALRRDARFFVCSDDAALEARFAAEPNVFVNPKTAYVEKLVDGPWRHDVADSDGLPYSSNIERNAASVIDACVDLLLLSAGPTIRTSTSSFLALAERLREAGYLARHGVSGRREPAPPVPAPTGAPLNPLQLLEQGIYVENITPPAELTRLIESLHPVQTQRDLIRIGGRNDGGYLLPDDLADLQACFSPGVAENASFEADLLSKAGVQSHLADYSVEGPPKDFVPKSFKKKFLGSVNDDVFTTLDAWVTEMEGMSLDGEFLLQMDIEGAEYSTLLSCSEQALKKFRIIAMEVHNIHAWGQRNFFKIVDDVFKKLLQHFHVVHNHVNTNDGLINLGGIVVPRTFELTLYRKDRSPAVGYITDFPHRLDASNVPGRDDLTLPAPWRRVAAT